MPRPDRKAHRLLEDRHREVDARLRRRLREVADALDLPDAVRAPFVRACARAAHLHTADCARADHEFRIGRSSSAEEEAARDEVSEGQWEETLVLLDAALTAERSGRPPPEPDDDDESHFQVRYQPMSRVMRPYPRPEG